MKDYDKDGETQKETNPTTFHNQLREGYTVLGFTFFTGMTYTLTIDALFHYLILNGMGL